MDLPTLELKKKKGKEGPRGRHTLTLVSVSADMNRGDRFSVQRVGVASSFIVDVGHIKSSGSWLTQRTGRASRQNWRKVQQIPSACR